MSDNSSYTDLAQRIEESFAEIEDEAISDFRETDEEYNALYQQILRLKENNPFIRNGDRRQRRNFFERRGTRSFDRVFSFAVQARRHGAPTALFQRTYRLHFLSEKGRRTVK